jgi:hypothetical protein
VELAAQAVAAPPVMGSRAGARIRAGGPAATLTDRQLDAELVHTLHNQQHADASARRAAERAEQAQSVVDSGGGPVLDRLRASGADDDVIARALRAATEDAAYLADHARHGADRAQGLYHHVGALLREINRRSQLTREQRRQEDWIRNGRAEARARDVVRSVHGVPGARRGIRDSAARPRTAGRPRGQSSAA